MGARITSPTFVGRRRELAELADALTRAEEGSSGTVLIAGDAGVGKSRLIQEFAQQARHRGAGVLVGGCLQIGDGTLPYAAVTEALRGLVDDLGVDTLRRVAGQSLRELGPLVPALGNPLGATTTRRSPDRTDGDGPLDGWADGAQVRLFDAVLGLLERLGRERPQVVVVEDLHWADQSTRELLVFLTRNLRDARVLVVATHRQDELEPGHPLRSILAELGRSDRVRSLDLAPFDREELTSQLEGILAAPPDRDLVDRILDRSQGYPFFVEELIASGAGAAGSPLSDGLREILLATLDTLPTSTRQVLRATAAAGRRVQHDLLAQVVELSPDEVDEAIRHAVNRRVLVADLDSGTYAFRHALFAEAIQTTLLPGERQRLHRRLAEVLEQDRSLAAEAAAAELAHHWHLARDDRRSLTASLEAAREAESLHAVVEARDHVERLATCWEQVADASEITGLDHTALLAWLAELTHNSGDVRRSTQLIEAALEELGDDADPVRRGLLLERFANCRSSMADEAGAAEIRELALATIPRLPPTAARAKVLASYAQSFWESDPARGREVLEEAVAIAREVGDAAVESRALTLLGASLSHLGDLEGARRQLRRAQVLAEEHAAPEEVVRAYTYLGVVLIRGGRVSEGADESLLGMQRARDLGLDRLYGVGLAGNATSGLFWAGRWDEAADLIAEAVGSSSLVGWLQLMQARLLAHRGDLEAAHRALETAQQHHSVDVDSRYPGVAMAVALLEGDTETADRIIRERESFAVPVHTGTVNELRALYLRGVADRADPDRMLADALLAETETQASLGIAHSEPWRLTAVAEHARISGERVVIAWEAALAAWRELDWPYLVAYASYRLAEAHLDGDADDGPQVEALLRDAEATASRLGAEPLRDDVVRLARRARLSIGRQASPQSNGDSPYGLTPRESEVLGLVADGLSNRDIGDRLYISQKTASVHVSNILRKLDVSGRGEAAALAFREGLVAGA